MDKIKKIKELIAQDFRVNGDRIVEIYREKFVYLEDSKGEGSVRSIDYPIDVWEEQEAERIEMLKAESGNSDIENFFRVNGVLHQYDDNKYKSTYPFGTTIIYGGKPNPGSTWNSEIYIMSCSTQRHQTNNWINKDGFTIKTQFTISKRTDSLIEASSKNGVPTFRQCHGWHKIGDYAKHHSYDQWSKDVDKAYKIFMKFFDKIFTDSPVQVSKKGVMFQKDATDTKDDHYGGKGKPNKFVTTIVQDLSDSGGWMQFSVVINQMEIVDKVKNKYRNMDHGLQVVPEFTGKKTKDEVRTEAELMFKDVLHRSGALAPFKY